MTVPERALRIALVSMHTNPFADPGGGDVGGMNVVVKHGALALAEQGHLVEVFTRRDEEESPDVECRGAVRLHRLRAGPARPASKAEQEEYVAGFSHGLTAALESARSRGRPWDVVHSHHWFSGAAAIGVARQADIAHIQSFHSIAARERGTWDLGEQPEGPGRIPTEAMLASESEAIIAVSRSEARTAMEIGADWGHVHVVTPGVDHSVFHPGTPHRDPLHLKARPTVLVAARLEPLKGIDLAIESIARIPEAVRPRLVVSGAPTGGYGGYDHELHRLVQEHGLTKDVWFAGPMTRADLACAMRQAHAVIVPSYSETYGLVALEAAACGTAVVAAKAGGLVDAVVDGRTGVLIDGREPAAWADTLRELLTDDVRRATMEKAATQYAARFTWEAMASAWAEIYRRQVALME